MISPRENRSITSANNSPKERELLGRLFTLASVRSLHNPIGRERRPLGELPHVVVALPGFDDSRLATVSGPLNHPNAALADQRRGRRGRNDTRAAAAHF
jgi:hypothetical protein